MLYRGALITDEPYYSSPAIKEPFTIIIADRIWDHCDEETLEEILDTIDNILDESGMDVEPMPEWRVKETERRIAKSKARAADVESYTQQITRLNEIIRELEAQIV